MSALVKKFRPFIQNVFPPRPFRILSNFSSRHRRHFLDPVLCDRNCLMMSHTIFYLCLLPKRQKATAVAKLYLEHNEQFWRKPNFCDTIPKYSRLIVHSSSGISAEPVYTKHATSTTLIKARRVDA